jgi:hypothetical protein
MNMAKPDQRDSELVKRARAGDKIAIRLLMERLRAPLAQLATAFDDKRLPLTVLLNVVGTSVHRALATFDEDDHGSFVDHALAHLVPAVTAVLGKPRTSHAN